MNDDAVARDPDPGGAGPLSGVRVIDVTQVVAGPYATSLLGDFGADVVKVEPVAGEPFRTVDGLYGPTDSGYFFGVNRSKRALALDLKSADGRDVMDRLLADADVVVVSMRPQALAELGLGYDAVHERFPHLVYCSITGFGESGPRAAQPGMDIIVQALGGIMGTTGEPGGPPVKVGPPVTDFATSYLACFGILAALRVKERTGAGQKVAVNLLDTAVSLLANFVTPYLKSLVPVRPVGGGHPQMVPYETYAAADGNLIVACLNERFWLNLCRAMERADLAVDPRFVTNADRLAHRAELTGILESLFGTRTVAEWEKILVENEVPVARINRLEDVLQDPQVLHNGMLTSLHHPRYGEIPVVNNPIRLSETPGRPGRYAPGIGEHTDEVLAEAGLTTEQVAFLRARGVIG